MMKRLISSMACILMVIPSPALANSFMSGAQEAVKNMNKNADALVNRLITQDMSAALAQASYEITRLSGSNQEVNRFIESVNRLANQYNEFLNNPDGNYEVTREHLIDSWDLYLDLYSQQISNSWKPASVTRDFESAPGMILLALNHLKENCGQGRFPADIDLSMPVADPLPDYEFDWNIMFRLGKDGQFSSADYQGINYVNDHKTRQMLFDAAKLAFAASTGTTAYGAAVAVSQLTGGASTTVAANAFSASLGGWASTGLAVMPYAAAAVVVMAMVMDFANREKMEKMQRKRVEAEFYKFDNTKRSQWLVSEYQQRCEAVVELVEPLVSDLKFIDAHFGNSEKIKEYYSADMAQMKKSHEKYQAFDEATCQLELVNLYEDNQCVTLDEYDKAKVNLDNKKIAALPSCVKSENEIGKIGCEIDRDPNGNLQVDKAFLENIISDFREEDQEAADIFAKQIPNLRFIIYKMFAKNYLNTQAALSKYLGNYLDFQRRKALNQLLKLAALYRDANNIDFAKDLQNELDAFGEFSRFQREFKELVAMAIETIFEKVDRDDFRTAVNTFHDRFAPFYSNYVHVNEVSDLNQKVHRLMRSMGMRAAEQR